MRIKKIKFEQPKMQHFQLSGDRCNRHVAAPLHLLSLQHVELGKGERDDRLLVAGQLLPGHDLAKSRFG